MKRQDNEMNKRVIWSALALLALPAAACTPLSGAIGESVWNGANQSVLQGEVRSVNTRQSRLEIRDDRGRSHTVRYDRRTQVVHRQRQLTVSSLERGDLVRIRVERDRNGTVWADRVEIRDSARDGRVATRTERVEGRVGQVNVRRGYFTLERDRGAALVVRTPDRLSNADARRFERLRRGERVRAEVRDLHRNQAELVRFR
jgi:hypothetical protein